MTVVQKIEKEVNGVNCEVCRTTEKPVYYIKNQDFAINIILCPKCFEKLKKEMSKTNLESEKKMKTEILIAPKEFLERDE